MTKDELYKKNKFFRDILDRNVELIKKDGFGNKKIERSHLTAKEKFIIDTFQLVSEIASKLDAIDSCIVLINSFPGSARWKKHFLRSEYIRYHLEVYYFNVIGIFDRLLLLVNHVYDLGFKGKDVKYGLIISNSHLQGTDTLKVLQKFYKALQNIRSVRNMIAHQSRLTDKELDDVQRYEFILEKSPGLSKEMRIMLKLKVRMGFSAFVQKKKKEIKSNNSAIIEALHVSWSSLLTKYTSQL